MLTRSVFPSIPALGLFGTTPEFWLDGQR